MCIRDRYWVGRRPDRPRPRCPVIAACTPRAAVRRSWANSSSLTTKAYRRKSQPPAGSVELVAAIDVAGYVADLKDHSVDHGFHVHDERHFVETYSLRQVWEVDLHPEDGCGGPLDLHLALDVDPRILLSFEDAVMGLPEDCLLYTSRCV